MIKTQKFITLANKGRFEDFVHDVEESVMLYHAESSAEQSCSQTCFGVCCPWAEIKLPWIPAPRDCNFESGGCENFFQCAYNAAKIHTGYSGFFPSYKAIMTGATNYPYDDDNRARFFAGSGGLVDGSYMAGTGEAWMDDQAYGA